MRAIIAGGGTASTNAPRKEGLAVGVGLAEERKGKVATKGKRGRVVCGKATARHLKMRSCGKG